MAMRAAPLSSKLAGNSITAARKPVVIAALLAAAAHQAHQGVGLLQRICRVL
jgi:hypothetical protein